MSKSSDFIALRPEIGLLAAAIDSTLPRNYRARPSPPGFRVLSAPNTAMSQLD